MFYYACDWRPRWRAERKLNTRQIWRNSGQEFSQNVVSASTQGSMKLTQFKIG